MSEGERRVVSVVPDIPYMRPRGGEARTTFFELFFDLVYVFAVTQMSHHLLADLSWAGAARTLFVLVAVYWAWNYTTWMANWFDPGTTGVRLILAFAMLASLLMAEAIPDAFGERGLLFALSYCALQVGRNIFVVAVTPPGGFHRNFTQILVWSVASVPAWVAGALVHGAARWVLWLVALGIELAAPLARYWVPGAGRTPMSEWEIDGGHFAERFQLFVIIALGESVVLAGVTASGRELSADVVVALGLAFVATTALWWLYFGRLADWVAQRLGGAPHDQVGRIGRDIYTYLHLPIVAGIVVVAVGVELVIAHPTHHFGYPAAAVSCLGPAVYLAGLAACAARVGHPAGPARLAAIPLLAALTPAAAELPGLAAFGAVTAVLVALAAVEEFQPRAARAARVGLDGPEFGPETATPAE